MKIAAIIHGNLRTFFMRLKDNDNYKEVCTLKQGHLDTLPEDYRVCDVFLNHVVKPNGIDVFAVTDTNNFYYNGEQHTKGGLFTETFVGDSKGNVELITEELKNLFGIYLKGLRVKTDDITKDKKLKLLTDAKSGGADPSKLVNQYLKIKHGFDLLNKYEKANGFKYDIILKTRFDNLHGAIELHIEKYDWDSYDVFIPGGEPPFIYDWCAFGNRKAMKLCNLYNRLGFTLDKRIYPNDTESTIASEHHLFRAFKDNNIKFATSGYYSCPLRFNHGYTI